VPGSAADNLRQIPPAPGTYVLVLACARRDALRIGRLGVLSICPGFYVYVGSAFGPGGLAARLGRHLRGGAARPHWHIDFLRAHAEPVEVFWCEGVRQEHRWAARIGELPGATSPLAGFGASDCTCRSHLFYFHQRPSGVTLGRNLGGLNVAPTASGRGEAGPEGAG